MVAHKDLILEAERILFDLAKEIMRLQDEGRITEAERYKNNMFCPAHKAMNKLNLVEEEWDRFFQKQPAPAVDDNQGPCG